MLSKEAGHELEMGMDDKGKDIRDALVLASDGEMANIEAIISNGIGKKPETIKEFKIKALKEAMATLSKNEAIKLYPELKKVYDFEPTAIEYYKSQKNIPESQKDEFLEKITDRAIEDIVAGKELPDFNKESTPTSSKPGPLNKEQKPTKQPRKDIDFD